MEANLEVELEISLKFPLLFKKVNEHECIYTGYVQIDDTDYEINLTISDKIILEITEELEKFKKEIEQLSKICGKNLILFLEKLQDTITRTTPQKQIEIFTPIYRKVLNEYYELKQFHIGIHKSKLSEDLSEIKISMQDEKNRIHTIVIGVNFNCGANFDNDKLFFIKTYDLPEFFDKSKFQPENSLISLYDRFVAEVESPIMQRFLDFMDEIDHYSWVLDPEVPSKKDVHRRIALEDNVSVTITYDSFNISNMPNVRFLGPQKFVKKYEERLNENYINWDSRSEEPLRELMNLLGINEFPQRPLADDEEDGLLIKTGECCICFTLRLNDKLPEVTCPNPSCSQLFHVECLYKWLSSLNSRRFYFEITEKCPNCEKIIRCPIPKNVYV